MADATSTSDDTAVPRLRRLRLALPERFRATTGHRFAWVSPMFLVLFGLTVFPLLFLLYLTVHKWSLLIAVQRGFVGLRNFETVLTGSEFWNALIVTLTFTATAVPAELILGTASALFIHRRLTPRWRSVFQTIFILPMMMAYVAVALIWRFLWNGSIGFINYLFTLVGLPTQGWLGDPTMALFTIVVADIWQWTPFVILVVLAGLEGLPDAPFEAAKMDGASSFQTFRYVTLPLLKPILIVVVLFRTADAFRIFDKVFLMTAGGPGNSSMTLSVLIYYRSFRAGAFGEAAVISVLMLAVISVIALTIIIQARRSGAI